MHDIAVGMLSCERERGKTVRYQIDPEYVNGKQRDGHSEQRSHEDSPNLRTVAGHDILHKLADIVENPAAFPYGSYDGGEVVVEQDQVCSFLADIRSVDAHSHTDVGGLQRRSIIDTIAGHGHIMSFLLQRPYYP